MSTVHLDALDYKILYELDKNARAPYNSIAKRVGVSKQTVKNRIDALVAKKVITMFITAINMANFGVDPLQIFIGLHTIPEEKKKELIAYLMQHPYVPQVAVCDGQYDLFFGITGLKPHMIDECLSEVYSRFSSYIKVKKIVHFVDTRLFTREYLVNKKREVITPDKGFHSRKISCVPIKDVDKKILICLAENPRMPFVEIAQRVKSSIQTVINRTQQLEREGMIRGYFYLLNETVFIQHMILLEFNVVTKELEQKLFAYFAAQPSAMFIVKLLGDYDLEVITETKTFEEYRNFIDDFKKAFAPSLKSFIPLLIRDFPKLNFLPPFVK